MKLGAVCNYLIFYALASSFAFAQQFSVGVKGGFPLTYSVSKTGIPDVAIDSASRRFIAGGTAELGLPFGLSVEGDFLYHPFNVRNLGNTANRGLITDYTVFEVPVVAKLRLSKGLARPYVEAGPEFRTHPSDLSISHAGFVLGGGIEFKLLLLKISPEVRYTHWTSGALGAANNNQVALLVGLSF